MKIVFFGSTKFSLYFLEHLFFKRKDTLIVVTTLDKPQGRGFIIKGNIIKEFCSKNHLMFYQFGDVNSSEAKEFLERQEPDLFLVVAFGQIFSKEVLKIPKIFSINVHASLLPKYRGAAPINWAIINGERKTGVSIIKMEEKLDSGPILGQKEIEIDLNDDVFSLEKKLVDLGKILLIETIEKIENRNISFIFQDDRYASFAPKLKKKDGLINWRMPAESIYNLIRGCKGWPSAFTYYRGKLLKIHQAELVTSKENSYLAGEIIEVSKNGILVGCGKDKLLIKELQLEGKRKMTVGEFICGHKIEIKEKLG